MAPSGKAGFEYATVFSRRSCGSLKTRGMENRVGLTFAICSADITVKLPAGIGMLLLKDTGRPDRRFRPSHHRQRAREGEVPWINIAEKQFLFSHLSDFQNQLRMPSDRDASELLTKLPLPDELTTAVGTSRPQRPYLQNDVGSALDKQKIVDRASSLEELSEIFRPLS